ncbi:sulfur carrier protein ThiS [Halodurantibacterium flavum]|uniref:Sulfur carrier protein ThiS n=1 Tax=Halodurantibacterium flavum TaxID=1382802 RepID=A0ABW4SAD5_9RHOB
MKIEINGQAQEVAADNLHDLVAELGLTAARIATAVNGEFVPSSARATRPLAEGDRVEVLSPMQGG